MSDSKGKGVGSPEGTQDGAFSWSSDEEDPQVAADAALARALASEEVPASEGASEGVDVARVQRAILEAWAVNLGPSVRYKSEGSSSRAPPRPSSVRPPAAPRGRRGRRSRRSFLDYLNRDDLR